MIDDEFLSNLIHTSHKIALEKGWWTEDKRRVSTKTLLMQSEISEAIEDFRNHRGLNEIYYYGKKPCGIPIELADVLIRIADFAGWHKLHLTAPLQLDADYPPDFQDGLADASYCISLVYDKSRHGESMELPLSQAVKALIFTCMHSGIDLEGALKTKEEYNKTRAYQHGGKAI